MDLSSERWTYLLIAFVLGALLGLLVQAYLRRGRAHHEMAALREQADTEAAALRSRLADIDGQRMQAVDRLTGLDAQFETLRTSSERALEVFAERIHDLEANLHGRDTQVRSAEAKWSAEASAHAQTRARLREVADAMDLLQGEHASVIADRQRIELELTALRDEVVGARGLVHEIHSAGRGREAMLEADIANLQGQLGESRVRLTATQQGERALKAELDEQLRQRDEQAAQRQALQDELEHTRSALSEAATRLGESGLEMDRLREALAAAQGAAEAADERERMLIAQVRSGQQQTQAAETLQARIASLESQQRDTEAVARQLREELQQARLQQTTATGEVASLKVALDAGREALAAQRARSQAMEAEAADLRRQLVELSATMKARGGEDQRLRDDLQRLTQRDAASTEEIARLRREADDARNALRIARSREETLLAEVGEMRAKANVERAAAERLATELNALQVPTLSSSKREFRPSVVASMDAAHLEELVVAAGHGRRPAGGGERSGDDVDDLKRIGGIGPVNEKWLHDQGIFHFWQIASWEPEEIAWVARHLPNFGARVYRENWVAQATRLARGEAVETTRQHGQRKQQ